MSEPVLKVHDFTVEFWVDGIWYPAAVNMNFEVNPGQVLAIVGESGSGKSTTAMGLMTLLASNARMSGSVKVKGQEMLGAKGSTLRYCSGIVIPNKPSSPISRKMVGSVVSLRKAS